MKNALLIAAALLALTGVAAAQETTGHQAGQGMLAAADTNHDGNISRAEFMAAQDARFTRMDANHDGTLTGDEKPHWSDGPNAISHADYTAHGASTFDTYDTNHDGQWSSAEIAAFTDHMHAMHDGAAH